MTLSYDSSYSIYKQILIANPILTLFAKSLLYYMQHLEIEDSAMSSVALRVTH